jgi:hypothetical protein
MPMHHAVAAAFVPLLLLAGTSHAGEKVEPGSDGITAEVRGTLRFESGRGYYVEAKAGDQATRVWLRVSEDKVLVRRLEGLTGKRVVAKGPLGQMPEDVKGSVPPHALYLATPFEIEAAKEK